jgi:hypothetical protein
MSGDVQQIAPADMTGQSTGQCSESGFLRHWRRSCEAG